MNLVIIEGAGKKDTIKKYLGSNYEVVATKGHIRDLPAKKLGVNLLKNYEPEYEIMPDKKDVVSMLKQKAQKAENILLATDPDREGEAISWHLAHILNLDTNKNIRIVFNEISKNAVTTALNNPRSIDHKLVDAQQARRVLDRLVGYKVSPILCKKIQPKLSAGRVQSVALKLVVDREQEIKNFKPEEYWTIVANLFKNSKTDNFKASLVKFNNKTIKIENEEQKNQVLQALNSGKFVVESIKKSVGKTRPQAPYTTSTMQQDASNKLGFSLKRTSSCAQELYEGVNIEGEGKVALVTYIRTDSVRVSPEATKMAKDYILTTFGDNYYPKTPNFFKSKTLAQDAHEAIRPISLDKTPDMVKPFISVENYKLYKLIYERFLASQMAESTYNQVVVEIVNTNYTFKASGKTPLFDGYLAAFGYDKNAKKAPKENDDEEEVTNDKIPPLNEKDVLQVIQIDTTQKFTKAPQRYTEATLVKEMEEKGIGRPATYTPTITTLDSRKYTQKDGKYLVPTELGEKVIELLTKYFSDIINVKFTANMEDELDIITQKDIEWQTVIKNFYGDFEKMLKEANQDYEKFKVPPKESDEICEKCGSPMVIRVGMYGEFMACSNYPACKNIRSKNKVLSDVKCPKCSGEISVKTSKRGTNFYGCNNYPTCDFVSWDKPTTTPCPKCSSYLTVKNLRGLNKYKCSNAECDYTKEEPK